MVLITAGPTGETSLNVDGWTNEAPPPGPHRSGTLLVEEDVDVDEPADHLRGRRAPVCSGARQAINSHFLLALPPPRRRRHISSPRGHRPGEDTDFPLGPRRRWRRVTLFLLSYRRQTCLHAPTEPLRPRSVARLKLLHLENRTKMDRAFPSMQTFAVGLRPPTTQAAIAPL